MSSPNAPSALLAAALAAAVPALSPPATAAAATTAFVDVTVLPLDRDVALAHQTVLVEADRIVAAGPAAEVAVPADARTIDGRGRFLVPGFTDAHVHLYSPIELPLYLANGVTTVVNLSGAPAHLEWRRQVAAGELLGPRIVTTGPAFTRSYTPAEAVRRVDEQAAAGYDGVKVYVEVGAEEYPALAAAARRHGLLLTGHVARGPGFAATLAAGQSIAHAEEFLYSFFSPDGRGGGPGDAVLDRARIPEAVRLTAAAKVAVTPTLSTYRDIVRQASDLAGYLRNPELALLPPWLRATLEPGLNRYHDRYAPAVLAHMRESLGFQRELVRALAAAGVPLLAGTDATSIGPVAGYAIHEELAELVAAGLTPYQALAAATGAPARWLGRESETGRVGAGMRADLVLLEADPRADIAATRRIAGTMAAGRWLDRSELDARVAAIPAAYERELAELVALLGHDIDAAEERLAAQDPLEVMAGAVLERFADREGAAAASRLLSELGARRPDSRLAGEGAVNELGYRYLAAGRSAEAIALFETNVANYPGSANAYDSLADAWAHTGATAKAVALYRRALEVDPAYPNAAFAREFLAGHGGAETPAAP